MERSDKEGKNKVPCSSYRPILVLNQDYKFHESIMFRRLDTFIPDLIDEDQPGFVWGRQNRRQHPNIKHYEKAFDCVSGEYLFLVLKRFGFTENLINSIKVLYSSPTARIKLNGRLTDSINLERSTWQGCPLSSSLFALFIEPLAQAIRENQNIQEITLLNTKLHFMQMTYYCMYIT